jgi:hypothetical protein
LVNEKRGQTPKDVPWWQIALALAVAIGLAALLFLGGRAAVRAFGQLETQVATAIITAFAAVVIAILSAFLTRLFDRRARAEAEQQAKRIPVYEEFVKGLLQGLGATTHRAKRKPADEYEMVKLFGDFTEKAIVWGSDDVLLAWLRFRAASIELSEDQKKRNPLEAMLHLEELFLALRADLGLSNKKLKDGDLLRLFINDLDVSPAKPGP